MAEVIKRATLTFGPDIMSKDMTVTAAETTECKAGYPLTLGADGKTATVGNVGGSGKVLGILAEAGTYGTSGKVAKVVIAGHVYADGIKEALPSADIDKLQVTPGKVIVVDRKEAMIYG